MNPQQAGFVPSYPPPPHDFAQFGYPYPPPATQPQQIPPYQYHPQQFSQAVPQQQQQQQQQQAQYLQQQSFRAPPQTISHPPPPQQQPQPHPQFRPQAPPPQQQQNVPSASPPSPGAGPGAPPAEPSSPIEENQDENNLNNDDDQPQQQYGPNGTDEHGAIFNIPPPPEATYPNEEELEKAIHAWSKDHGYELVRRASKRNAKGVLYKRYYHCSKHGKKANTGKLTDETRQRVNRKSGRVDCPMSLAAVAVDPTDPEGEWQIRHRKGHHNHGPFRAVELAGHRRRARMGEVEKIIDGLFAIGTGTAQVLQFLQKGHPEGLFTRTDVANMKNRFRKWGTCADRIQRGENHVSTVKYKNQLGIPIPCIPCRQGKLVCGMERPVCAICVGSGVVCQYSHEQQDDVEMEEGTAAPGQSIDLTTPTAPQTQQVNGATAQQPTTPTARSKRGRPSAATQEQTAQILASLQTFQSSTNNSLPIQRLTLQSSSVEVLAQSSCGNGDSYLSLPNLNTERDWPAFRDAMTAAAMKENTCDVLTGMKVEPPRPPGPDTQLIEVEIWNEYVNQLAVFKRRNELLLSALMSKTGPLFKQRFFGLGKASEVWALLEEMCAPRGSETAWRLYNDLYNINLTTSTSLQNYVSRLEGAWTQFKQLKLNPGPQSGAQAKGKAKAKPTPQQQPFPQAGSEVLTDESMVFLFLRGLGPEWGRWVEGFCATSNLAGFGTGERVGFRQVSRAALRAEGSGRRSGG